jgi:hypothetical protein
MTWERAATEWERAASEWANFLNDTNRIRRELKCSWSSPWFRGHNDSTHVLLPSLLRDKHPRDKKRISENEEIKRQHLANLPNQKNEVSGSRRVLYSARTAGSSTTSAAARLLRSKNSMRHSRQLIDGCDRRIRESELIPTGEREVFIEYSARAGIQANNSWEILADMQHNGIPTRLLDWSETLSSALFFAMRNYVELINIVWRDDRKISKDGPLARTPSEILSAIGPLPTPSIWIVNPFKLSEVASERIRIWDLTRQSQYDYFQQFIIEKEWEFSKPIPMYSPWRSPRIAAQQGTFLVWGRDHRPLNEIVDKTIVQETKITELAAIYCVYMLTHLLAIDHFSMFRDMDSLATALTDKYLVHRRKKPLVPYQEFEQLVRTFGDKTHELQPHLRVDLLGHLEVIKRRYGIERDNTERPEQDDGSS